MEARADIALIGLAVMGQNLIFNMNDHGFTVVAFNRTVSKVDDFLNKEAKGHQRHRRPFDRRNGGAAQAPTARDADGEGRSSRR